MAKSEHRPKHGGVTLIPGGKRTVQGVEEFSTSSYLVSTDISTNVNGGVDVDADSDGNLVFKSGDTVIYTLPTDALGQLEASFALGGSEFTASVSAKLPSVPGLESEVSLNSDGSVTLTMNSHDLDNAITFKPDGEIEIETSVKRDIQGQSVELKASTTLTLRPGTKQPANQPAEQRETLAAPTTKHATATQPSEIAAERKSYKAHPWTYSPRYGDMPPAAVPAPGFALVDAVDPQTAQAALDYAIKWVVGALEGAGADAVEGG